MNMVAMQELPEVSENFGKLNVLVLEDDVLIQGIFENIMKRHGHSAAICNDVESARMSLCNDDYDMILLDVNPSECELELIPEIRFLMPHADIITMTGANSMTLEKQVRAHRVAYHLIKPFDIEELVSLLNHLETRKLLGSSQANMEEKS